MNQDSLKNVKLTLILILTTLNQSCMENKSLEKNGEKAYAAWQVGELTGNYSDFKKLLSNDFNFFSHPSAVRGVFKGEEAKTKITELMANREKLKNALTFSNPVFMTTSNQVAVQFNSKGTVMNGQFPYQGYNIIVFGFNDNKIVSFREYFGDVDPAWFKN